MQSIQRGNLIEVNEIFVNEYFQNLTKTIRQYNKKFPKDKDYLVNIQSPNVCLCKDIEFDMLTEFANDLKGLYSRIDNNDIIIGLLMGFYSITMIEYDDDMYYKNMLKYCKNKENVLCLYMAIGGITYTHKYVDMKGYRCIDLHSENDIFRKIRKYMIKGYTCEEIDIDCERYDRNRVPITQFNCCNYQ